MTEPEIIVERKKYGSSAMDYTMRVYQKLNLFGTLFRYCDFRISDFERINL